MSFAFLRNNSKKKSYKDSYTVGLGQFSSNIIQQKAGFCKCLSSSLYNNNVTIPGTSTPRVY